ncbi:MAG: polymer-forming cytoskeletal protein [Candidatus Acidiferrales bacterium]
MWGKSEEAKPSSPGTKAPEPKVAAPNASISVSSSAPPTAPVAAANVAPTAAASVGSANAAPAPIALPATVAAPPRAADLATAISSTSTIGAGLKIRGDISGASNLIIEGEAQGKIRLANGSVTVGASGRVEADIEAAEISIEGRVQGNLKARDSVRLGPASNVQGGVLTPRIRIEDGARLRGKVEMLRAGDVVSGNPSNAAGIPASGALPVVAPAISETPKAAAATAKAPGA